ncbi:protein of unknown function DUF1016 [Pseudarthrobacter chlorophenolicus A6]|uniref:YhcG N-terminal domain-containing protein n=1 Tax=Pseudarthrobacter chlorophenolicus (strain ATCC 700700 / DSM 12829 / CIP 107037 / JCM 12360 / KCTC 9906 / NCIMB 13794 / A6) TaxID=452863 RepID=B8HE52_PSECP|nr:DUF1016 N-terminal domain-containing protein [Pseudarthrobacter chlorophenolicus]ACL39087.1 protein of unknown function DUF1016 [Pseudarthrobacter chlorophenolicus A6]SDR04601.1 Protein of unknown function [Pseudarthrobacter chlorophenolicus]
MSPGGGEIQPGARQYSTDASFPAKPAVSAMPEWYPEMLAPVTRQVSIGRSTAISAANQQLLASYFAVGQDIPDRQTHEGWGARIIDRLSADLKDQFPGASGFSPRNLKYMRAFAETWPAGAIVQAPLTKLPCYHHRAQIQRLDNHTTPIGVAEWTDTMVKHLPSIRELEAELSQDIPE